MSTEFITYPSFGHIPTYPTFTALPAVASQGDLAITLDTLTLYIYNAALPGWQAIGSPGDVLSIGTLDGNAPSVNGATILAGALILQSASVLYPGLVNTNTQSFAGNKTFTGTISASNLSGTNTGDVTLTAVGSSPNANAASLSGQVLTLQPASGSFPGVVSTTTQSFAGNKTFTGAISASNLSGTNSGDVTIGTANGLSLVGQALSLGLASTSTTGALSSTDWNTFNSKAPSGAYLTGLTGDIQASGAGVAPSTILFIQGNPIYNTTGTVNVVFSASPTLTGTLNAGSGVFSSTLSASNLSGTNTGDQTITLTGDVTGSGTGSFATTIASNVVSNSKLAQMPTLTLKGNNTGGTANASDLTVSQVQSLLSVPTSSSPLPLNAGGTGTSAASANAAFNALSPLTTKGDLLGFSTVNARLPVGTDGQNLVADSTQPLGIKWASATAGTSVIGTIDGNGASANGLSISGVTLYAQSASASNPGMINTTTQSFAGDKTFTGTISASNLSGTNSGDVTLGNVGSSPNLNAASLSGQVLTLQPASSGFPGVVTTGTQTFAGNKTFTGTISASNLSGTNTGDQTITLTGPVTGSGTGSFATTIGNNVVTLGNIAQIGGPSFLGNSGGVTSNVAVLNATTATSMLNLFTSSLQGLVPSSGGGTTNFLRADGTFAAPSGSFTNPMTTLGDIIYEDNTPTAVRLAGNTTSTKKFLTQTGTGSVSAAPGWGTIAAGDVPTLNQNTTGTAANITATSNSTLTTLSSLSLPGSQVSGAVATATAPGTGSAHGAVTLDSSGHFQSVAPGTSGNVLTSNGTDWASTAPAAGPTGSYWSGYTGGTNFTVSASSYTDFSNSGGNAVTQRTGSGITVTAAGSNLPGITWTPASSSAVYLITAFCAPHPGTLNNVSLRLYDGSTEITQVGWYQSTSVPVRLTAVYAPATSSAVTVKLQACASSSSTVTISAQGQVSEGLIEWTLVRIV